MADAKNQPTQPKQAGGGPVPSVDEVRERMDNVREPQHEQDPTKVPQSVQDGAVIGGGPIGGLTYEQVLAEAEHLGLDTSGDIEAVRQRLYDRSAEQLEAQKPKNQGRKSEY